jgi:hypothetical protein
MGQAEAEAVYRPSLPVIWEAKGQQAKPPGLERSRGVIVARGSWPGRYYPGRGLFVASK